MDVVNVLCGRYSVFHNGQWLVWFVVINKAYGHGVFCSFSFLLNVVNIAWMNEQISVGTFHEAYGWPPWRLALNDIDTTRKTYNSLPLKSNLTT